LRLVRSRSPSAPAIPPRWAASYFGLRYLHVGLPHRAHKPAPPHGRFFLPDRCRGVVITQVASPLAGYEPEDAHVPVGHGRPPSGSGIGIDAARASGIELGASSRL
jgi:hypothetical protein